MRVDRIIKLLQDMYEPNEELMIDWEEDEDEEELSPCCGATLTWGDLCSDCKEHT